MRYPLSTGHNKMLRAFGILVLGVIAALVPGTVQAQRLAIIAPERNEISSLFAERLRDTLVALGKKVLDLDSSNSAFKIAAVDTPFNMTVDQSRRVGEIVGSDLVVLIKGSTQRRTSLEKRGYFESSAAIFVVSSRSGRLVHWEIGSNESDAAKTAEAGLLAAAADIAKTVARKSETVFVEELAPPQNSVIFPEPPAEGSAASAGFKPPIPYNRIKPLYSEIAYLHDVRATVDIEVSIDETGKIAAADITRWAGYGLDGSVMTAVRSMNWRPAERNGKRLPMRILLRYNFTKIEKEDR